MFKEKTIQKVVKSLNLAIENYRHRIDALENIVPTISNGNRKIGLVMNVSTAPIVTCGHVCKHCKGFCYDVKACLQYNNTVIPARAKNTALALYNRDFFFAAIDAKMSRRRKNKFFRWHVAGDIIDLDYFVRMIAIAKNHSDFVIWTYTKQYSIVNAYCNVYGKNTIPANMHIMFSKWDGLAMDNPYNFPVFACKLKAGNKDTSEAWFDNTFKCPGNCDICKTCKRGCVVGESAWCDEH